MMTCTTIFCLSLPLDVMVMHKIQLLTVAIGESVGDSIQRGSEGVGEATWTNK